MIVCQLGRGAGNAVAFDHGTPLFEGHIGKVVWYRIAWGPGDKVQVATHRIDAQAIG